MYKVEGFVSWASVSLKALIWEGVALWLGTIVYQVEVLFEELDVELVEVEVVEVDGSSLLFSGFGPSTMGGGGGPSTPGSGQKKMHGKRNDGNSGHPGRIHWILTNGQGRFQMMPSRPSGKINTGTTVVLPWEFVVVTQVSPVTFKLSPETYCTENPGGAVVIVAVGNQQAGHGEHVVEPIVVDRGLPVLTMQAGHGEHVALAVFTAVEPGSGRLPVVDGGAFPLETETECGLLPEILFKVVVELSPSRLVRGCPWECVPALVTVNETSDNEFLVFGEVAVTEGLELPWITEVKRLACESVPVVVDGKITPTEENEDLAEAGLVTECIELAWTAEDNEDLVEAGLVAECIELAWTTEVKRLPSESVLIVVNDDGTPVWKADVSIDAGLTTEGIELSWITDVNSIPRELVPVVVNEDGNFVPVAPIDVGLETVAALEALGFEDVKVPWMLEVNRLPWAPVPVVVKENETAVWEAGEPLIDVVWAPGVRLMPSEIVGVTFDWKTEVNRLPFAFVPVVVKKTGTSDRELAADVILALWAWDLLVEGGKVACVIVVNELPCVSVSRLVDEKGTAEWETGGPPADTVLEILFEDTLTEVKKVVWMMVVNRLPCASVLVLVNEKGMADWPIVDVPAVFWPDTDAGCKDVVRLWDPGIDEDDAGIVLVRLTDTGMDDVVTGDIRKGVVRLEGIDTKEADVRWEFARLEDIGANEDRDTPPLAPLEAKEDVPVNESSWEVFAISVEVPIIETDDSALAEVPGQSVTVGWQEVMVKTSVLEIVSVDPPVSTLDRDVVDCVEIEKVSGAEGE
jgi:hypothetical protein